MTPDEPTGGAPNTDPNPVPVNEISFTIDQQQFTAEDGMTWYEWIESSYPTDGLGLVVDGRYIGPDENHVVFIDDVTVGDGVNPSDTILNGGSYTIKHVSSIN